MTDSGYPREVKLWQRGTALEQAKPIFTGDKTSVAVSGWVLFDDKTPLSLVTEAHTFYTASQYVYQDGKLIGLPLPQDAEIKGYFKGKLFIELKSDLTNKDGNFKQGAVVYADVADLIAQKAKFSLFVSPTQTASIAQLSFSKSAIFVNWLDNVKSKLVRYEQDERALGKAPKSHSKRMAP